MAHLPLRKILSAGRVSFSLKKVAPLGAKADADSGFPRGPTLTVWGRSGGFAERAAGRCAFSAWGLGGFPPTSSPGIYRGIAC